MDIMSRWFVVLTWGFAEVSRTALHHVRSGVVSPWFQSGVSHRFEHGHTSLSVELWLDRVQRRVGVHVRVSFRHDGTDRVETIRAEGTFPQPEDMSQSDDPSRRDDVLLLETLLALWIVVSSPPTPDRRPHTDPSGEPEKPDGSAAMVTIVPTAVGQPVVITCQRSASRGGRVRDGTQRARAANFSREEIG